ncbi:hypothetical protein CBR_g78816 [Chara braunii]|uniref:Protein kinase domain-containing protein n=1 Tax=Chara braunii TaxID=69332 RepID=A0A388KAE8_CHABU|nr:hypothetical protein CBR_g78816 [Chara braunii]|eukprot:GBG67035.1 hypothetical protein CBR_g78816 [Chara braunii]
MLVDCSRPRPIAVDMAKGLRLRTCSTGIVVFCSFLLLLVGDGCLRLIDGSTPRGGQKLKAGACRGEENATTSYTPSLAMAKVVDLRSGGDHEPVPRDSAGGLEARSLADVGERVFVEDRDLFPSGSASIVIAFPGQSPFETVSNGTLLCTSSITSLVGQDDSPIFYFILDELCRDEALGEYTEHRMSIRKAVVGGSPSGGDGGLLSYWWEHLNGTGDAVLTPTVINPDRGMAMANLYSIDLTLSGSHLILAATADSVALKSRMIFVNVTTGGRESVRTAWDNLYTIAFNANKSRLFAADEMDPRRILAASTETGVEAISTNGEMTLQTFREFPLRLPPNISFIQFSTQSFDPQDRCLYFPDFENNMLRSLNLSNPQANLTHVAGSGETGQQEGDAFSASLNGLSEPVVTRDGCNVFSVQVDGVHRWFKLEAPCGKAVSVSTVARYTGVGWEGLALHHVGDNASLLVGSKDGKVLKLDINSSALHVCKPFGYAEDPTPPSSASTPSPSPPAPEGNDPSLLDSFPSPDVSSAARDSTSDHKWAVYVGPVVGAFIFLVIVVAAVCTICPQRRQTLGLVKSKGGTSSLTLGSSFGPGVSVDSGLKPTAVQEFPLAVLVHSTENFDDQYRIGEKGAFGEVYWGDIGNKRVAIKVMIGELTAVKRQQFLAEVNTLSRLHHGNLIELIGYCQEGKRSILVYSLFSGGSLHHRLHKRHKVGEKERLPALTLSERASVACQIANALSYLHHGADPPVIHRDIKSRNVLLSDGSGASLRTVVADFGLATIGQSIFETTFESVVETCHVAGTQGYMAPEYLTMGRLTAKVGVYAYGVIVLELLTGRNSVFPRQPPSVNGEWMTLPQWVRTYTHLSQFDLLMTVLDEPLREEVESSLANQHMVMDIISLAMDCVQEADAMRPNMSTVLQRISTVVADAGTDYLK